MRDDKENRRLSRRQFCGLGLVAPIANKNNRNRRKHYKDTILYRGAIKLPDEVCSIAANSDVYKTTNRKLAVRIKVDNIVYIMRVVCGKNYIGEIVKTQLGEIRVHVWQIIEKDGKLLSDIIGEE